MNTEREEGTLARCHAKEGLEFVISDKLMQIYNLLFDQLRFSAKQDDCMQYSLTDLRIVCVAISCERHTAPIHSK